MTVKVPLDVGRMSALLSHSLLSITWFECYVMLKRLLQLLDSGLEKRNAPQSRQGCRNDGMDFKRTSGVCGGRRRRSLENGARRARVFQRKPIASVRLKK